MATVSGSAGQGCLPAAGACWARLSAPCGWLSPGVAATDWWARRLVCAVCRCRQRTACSTDKVLPYSMKRGLIHQPRHASPAPSQPSNEQAVLPDTPATAKGHQGGVACGAGAPAHRGRQRAGGLCPVNELANLPHLRRRCSQCFGHTLSVNGRAAAALASAAACRCHGKPAALGACSGPCCAVLRPASPSCGTWRCTPSLLPACSPGRAAARCGWTQPAGRHTRGDGS